MLVVVVGGSPFGGRVLRGLPRPVGPLPSMRTKARVFLAMVPGAGFQHAAIWSGFGAGGDDGARVDGVGIEQNPEARCGAAA